MLFVTDSIQRVQREPYPGSSWRVRRLQMWENVLLTVKYAYDLEQLAKDETLLQGMIDRLTENHKIL
jgi:hypothetical protein